MPLWVLRIEGELRFKSNGVVTVKRLSGFTLLELIIVVALIGLLLVVSVPGMRDTLFDDPLKSASRKIIGYVGGVREKAIREQQSYLLYIDIDENRLWYIQEREERPGKQEPPEEGVLQLHEDVDLRDIWAKATGTTSRGVPELWISRQGYLDQTILHLENDDGDGLSLVISPLLPGIEVQEGYYEIQ